MDVEKKNLNKEILHIALPGIIESLFISVTAIIDSKMVSALGLGAIAAISVTNQPKLFILSLFFAINTTISSLVAKQFGKKDRTEANRLLLIALFLVIVASFIVGAICVFFAEQIMVVCSNQADTMKDSVLYFRIIMMGLPLQSISMVINASLRGYGKTKLTLISNIFSCCLNILLNYMLIEGHWGAPALGVMGAGIATVAGIFGSTIICFVIVCQKSSFINLNFCFKEKICFKTECFFNILKMWKKIFAENIFTRIGFLITGIIAARAGTFAISVYSVGMHLLNVSFALGSGMQSAAVALVGKSHGKENKEDIKKYSQRILRLGTCSASILGLVFILFAKPYYSFFGDDKDFILIGIMSCVIIGIISPIQVRQIIYNGIFQGIGQVQYTMRAAIISVALVNTIISFVGTILLQGGIWGVWAGSFANQLVRMLLLNHHYKKFVQKEA